MSLGNGEEPHNSRHACAACKHQRKKCEQDCIFAPHYPAARANYFREVHKIFGVKNITQILEHLSTAEDRERAIESLEWEALAWKEDPANGPLGALRKLEKEVELLKNHQQINYNNSPQQYAMPYHTKPGSSFIGFNHNSAGFVANYNSNVNAPNFGFANTQNLGLDHATMNNFGGFLPRGEVENQVAGNYISYLIPQEQGRQAMQDDVVAPTTNILAKQETQRNHQTLDSVMIGKPAASFNIQGPHQRGNQAGFHASSQGQGRSLP